MSFSAVLSKHEESDSSLLPFSQDAQQFGLGTGSLKWWRHFLQVQWQQLAADLSAFNRNSFGQRFFNICGSLAPSTS